MQSKTLVQFAISYRDHATLKSLIAAKATVDVPDRPALAVALSIKPQDERVLEALLDAKADPNAKLKVGRRSGA